MSGDREYVDTGDLLNAIERMGGQLAGSIDALGHLTCSEFEPIAEVLVIAGFDKYARDVFIGHGLGDNEETDRHHALYDTDNAEEIADGFVRALKVEYGFPL